jgi:hypothetical protein
MTTPTAIQSGDICGDKFALTFRKRRRAPKKGLAKHNQGLVSLRKLPEDIEKRGILGRIPSKCQMKTVTFEHASAVGMRQVSLGWSERVRAREHRVGWLTGA